MVIATYYACGVRRPLRFLNGQTMTWILAFLALAILDFCWALYVGKVKDGNAMQAGLWAIALYALGAGATIGWIENHWLLLPACAGAFVGTCVGVLWNKRKPR